MKNNLRFIALLGAFAIVVAACGASSPDTTLAEQGAGAPGETQTTGGAIAGGEVVVAQGVDIVSGDPANQPALSDRAVGLLVSEPLVIFDSSGELAPVLATSWESVDDLTWHFAIREGVTFHDGSAMTIDDVVYTFERLLDEEKAFRNAPNISTIESVRAVDEATLEVRTSQPDAVLPARMVWAPIVPKAHLESVGDEAFGFDPVGTGPYQFTEWVRDDHISLDKYEGYWGDEPKPDRITFRTLPEGSARLSALQTGEVDLITNLPPDLVAVAEADEGVEVEKVPSVRFVFIGISVDNPPLDDVRVRKALNYAIDREAIIEGVLGGNGRLSGYMIGPAVHGYHESIEDSAYTYDPERARALLAEAGYPDGLDITLNLEGPRGRYLGDAEILEAVAGQLAEIGVQTNLGITDWGTYYPSWAAMEAEHLWFLGQGNPLLDFEYSLNIVLHSNGRGYFGNDDMDALIEEQRANMDPVSREQQLIDLHKRVVEDEVPFIFLWDQVDIYARSAELCGWEPRSDEQIDLVSAGAC